MKTSAIKIFNTFLQKKNINKYKKFLNVKGVVFIAGFIILFSVLFHYLKPSYFDFQKNKTIVEKKINTALGINSKIDGEIVYKIFPLPRLIINDIRLNFSENKKNYINIDKINIFLSHLNLNSIKEIELTKVLISKQKIKILTDEFSNYINYFSEFKKIKIQINDSNIFFIDKQNNDIIFENFSLNEKYTNSSKKLKILGKFAKKDFDIVFKNNLNKDKYLNFNYPDLDTSLKITFDKNSNLEDSSGIIKMNILNNIFLINFKKNDELLISDSFLRNKFLNSKINGKVFFKESFLFDLNLSVNQADFRKLFLYYSSIFEDKYFNKIQISKKLNGSLNVTSKSANSFIGKLKDIKVNLIFENGDLKIKKGSIVLPHKSNVIFDLSLISDKSDQILKFFINFNTDQPKKFLRKLDVNYSDDESLNVLSEGTINLSNKKIKFKNILLNRSKIGKKTTLELESLFNKSILEDTSWGVLDFFKFKKFLAEVNLLN